MKVLIGYTGFVGSNLNVQIHFDKKYNSKNIEEIRGKEFEIVYCAGVSAIKWLANQNPEKDMFAINKLIENLKTIKANMFILISTIDVYSNFIEVDEDTVPEIEKQDSYGKNRFILENWVKNNFQNYLIVRLPALFGKGLKKNFIYDLLNPTPNTIIESKWKELKENMKKSEFFYLERNYQKDSNNNYQFEKNKITKLEETKLEEIFKKYKFTSLNFTDSRSSFPFYYLKNLSKDIEKALENNIKILNLSVEPITCEEVAKKVFNLELNNIIVDKEPVRYDMKSKYYELYNGVKGYLYGKKETIEYLKEFIKQEKENEVGNL